MNNKSIYNETISLIKEIYKRSSWGGALHVVLDDGNMENCHIHWCLENSIEKIKNQEEKELYTKCAENLLKMTESQRCKCTSEAFK